MNARHPFNVTHRHFGDWLHDSGLEPDSNSDSPQLDKWYPEGGRDTS